MPVARIHTSVDAGNLRALADALPGALPNADPGMRLAINAIRNVARYAPAGKRIELSIDWYMPEYPPAPGDSEE